MALRNVIDPRKLRTQAILDKLGQKPTEEEDPFETGQSPPTFPEGGTLPQDSPRFEETVTVDAKMPDDARQPTDKPSISFMDLWNQHYKPETESTERFNKLIDDIPVREKPGLHRRIAASAAMAGRPRDGVETAEKFMYAPHHRALADWKEKTGPTHQAANLERFANANERTATGQMAQYELGQQKLDTQEKIAAEKAEIARVRAEAYDFKQRNPDWKINFENGRIKAVNPQSPNQVRDLGSSGGMSQYDLENLKGEWRVKAAQEQGANALERTESAGWDTYQYPDGTIVRWNRRTGEKETHPPPAKGESGAGSGPLNRIGTPNAAGETTPQEVEQTRVNQANKMRAKYPDWDRKITIDAQGNIKVQPPSRSTITGRVDPEEARKYEEITKEIFGTASPAVEEKPWTWPKGLGGISSWEKSAPKPTSRGGAAAAPAASGAFSPIIQHSESTGKYRISTDGGKTWQPYTPSGDK